MKLAFSQLFSRFKRVQDRTTLRVDALRASYLLGIPQTQNQEQHQEQNQEQNQEQHQEQHQEQIKSKSRAQAKQKATPFGGLGRQPSGFR